MAEDESIVIRPREFDEGLLLPESTSELAKFMDEPFPAIAEMITGAMASGPKAWMVMGGRIVQAIFKAKLFQQVSEEIKELRDMGAIEEDYADEVKYKYGAKTWVELFAAIDDQDSPDADRLESLKAMFYRVNKINATDSERILAYQMFQTAKRLNSGELLVLRCAYDAYKANRFDVNSGMVSVLDWAQTLNSKLVDVIVRDQDKLVQQGLLSPYLGSLEAYLHSRRVTVGNARLTDLGIKFCEAIHDYQLVREQIDLRRKRQTKHSAKGERS